MCFLRPLESSIGMFQCLFGMLFFPVVRGDSTVRVCGEFVVLGSSSVRVIMALCLSSLETTPSWSHPVLQTVQY